LICFRAGSSRDERVLLPHFSPYIGKGEISNLSAYNFYIHIRAQDVLEPTSGKTVILQSGIQIPSKVIASSRRKYSKSVRLKSTNSSETEPRIRKIKVPEMGIPR
jgi:hypothetical protein